mgnify:CR=1 FL=1
MEACYILKFKWLAMSQMDYQRRLLLPQLMKKRFGGGILELAAGWSGGLSVIDILCP